MRGHFITSAFAFGALLSTEVVWQQVATMFGSAAIWAQRRATPEQDAVDELTMRLRQPIVWASRHPVQAAVRFARKADRRHES